jgi:hypothetical protein
MVAGIPAAALICTTASRLQQLERQAEQCGCVVPVRVFFCACVGRHSS